MLRFLMSLLLLLLFLALRFINHHHNFVSNICCDFIIVFDAFFASHIDR